MNLKFRAYDKSTKEIIYFDLERLCAYEGEVTAVLLPDLITILTEQKDSLSLNKINKDLEITQYTGIKDREGEEIYHKDIITDGEDYATVEYGEYKDEYGQESFGFYIVVNSTGSIYSIITAKECKIAGNLFETPQLLWPEQGGNIESIQMYRAEP